jgi:adenosine deaminase
MEAKMRYQKVEKIVEELRRKGFDMATKEFFNKTVYQILKRYSITDRLDLDEYFELLRRLMDMCAENDLKDMGMSYLDDNDWKYK